MLLLEEMGRKPERKYASFINASLFLLAPLRQVRSWRSWMWVKSWSTEDRLGEHLCSLSTNVGLVPCKAPSPAQGFQEHRRYVVCIYDDQVSFSGSRAVGPGASSRATSVPTAEVLEAIGCLRAFQHYGCSAQSRSKNTCSFACFTRIPETFKVHVVKILSILPFITPPTQNWDRQIQGTNSLRY